MTDPTHSLPKKNWKKYFTAGYLGVYAAFLSLIVSIFMGYYAYRTIKEAGRDAARGRLQQQILSQGNVMSMCMNEFFQIRHDASDWAKTNSPATAETYSDRMYGLHFEEYHLFQRGLIPQHIYTIWLRRLVKETSRTDESELPRLDFKRNLTNELDPDFIRFYTSVFDPANSNRMDAVVAQERESSREMVKGEAENVLGNEK